MSKIIVYTFLLLSCSIFSFAQNAAPITKLKNDRALSHAQIGLFVQNVDGKVIAEINKDVSLSPASTLKLITTATSLEILGENFRYITDLKYGDGKILVKGSGDPTLGSEHVSASRTFLSEWVKQIEVLKLKSPVSVYIQDELFGYMGTSNKWIKEDLGNYYAAGAYGISVFDNAYRLFFNTMDTDNAPKIIKTDPVMSNLAFTNLLGLNNAGKDNGYILGEPFSNRRTLVGDIPARQSSFSIKGDIPDPGLYLGNVFANELKNSNIDVIKVETSRNDYYLQMYPLSKRMNGDDSFKTVYSHQSVPLRDIIRVVNVKSNNHYSEHLIRTVGRQQNKDIYSDPLQAGISYVSDYWAKKGFDTGALFMYDGCGLSPSNAVSPRLMCDVLRYMNNESRYADAFRNSLPKAGTEGTVRSFLKGTRLAGKVLVKSGSIAKVQAYSGYYIDGENVYVFSVMVNNFRNEDRRGVIKAIEDLLLDVLP